MRPLWPKVKWHPKLDSSMAQFLEVFVFTGHFCGILIVTQALLFGHGNERPPTWRGSTSFQLHCECKVCVVQEVYGQNIPLHAWSMFWKCCRNNAVQGSGSLFGTAIHPFDYWMIEIRVNTWWDATVIRCAHSISLLILMKGFSVGW